MGKYEIYYKLMKGDAEMTLIEMVRFTKECFPEYKGQLFMNITDLGKIFGVHRDTMRNHLRSCCVPWYTIGTVRMYNVLEVLDSVQKTRGRG